MPPLPPAPKVLRIDHIFDVGEDLKAKCRVFQQYTGTAPTASDLTTFLNSLSGDFATNLAALMFSSYVLEFLVGTDLSSATSALAEVASGVAGTRSGPPVPADACTLESRQVARRFRGGHSRVYWPFGTEPDLQDVQTWKASYVTAVETALSNYQAALSAAVWSGGGVLSPVAVSFYEGFTVHTGVTGRARNVSTVRLSALVDPIVAVVVRTGLASQRKRLLRLA